MGNGIGKIGVCFTGGAGEVHHHHDMYVSEPYEEGLGHSFCYVRPDPTRIPASGISSKIHSEESAATSSIFRTISGASVSANTSTFPLSARTDPDPATATSGPLFESSTSFAAVPLQPVPRSGSLLLLEPDRGFMSGPIERGFLSGPLDQADPVFSGPFDRSFSHSQYGRFRPKKRSKSLIQGLRRVMSKFGQSSVVAPVKGQDNWVVDGPESRTNKSNEMMGTRGSLNLSSDMNLEEMSSWEIENLQWAQGKAGEDRVHVVVSEEHGWVFVGIYDGFNGPDATDFLLSNLYSSVQNELKGLLWDDGSNSDSSSSYSFGASGGNFFDFSEQGNSTSGVGESDRNRGRISKAKFRGAAKKWQENQRRWKYEWDRERLELDRRLKDQSYQNDSDLHSGGGGGLKAINHGEVLKAMSGALKKTEETFLDIADKMLDENPELCLMGSCVLAMLMKGEDVYVMNVGDSRAVLAQNKEADDLRLGKIDQDLERINEESLYDFQVSNGVKPSLRAFQLTMDHSTCIQEEVIRIKDEHPDDALAVVNDRVKGLKVTRAFGAGFLKQPKWNNALLEMFRIEYVGTSPYISCQPSLYHHKLGPKDQFLILSSDGLYQYFTNEEAIAEVELFISLSPEGDPAQHLVEEVLFRAANKAGMDFHELLEIPQGDRRKYHDDVSIIIISFEGRIWRSCV